MEVGDAIKLLRTSAGLKQSVLAERIGVSPNYISLVENGKRDPSMSFLRSISEEFGIPLGLLFLDVYSNKESSSPEERAILLRIQELLFEVHRLRLKAEV